MLLVLSKNDVIQVIIPILLKSEYQVTTDTVTEVWKLRLTLEPTTTDTSSTTRSWPSAIQERETNSIYGVRVRSPSPSPTGTYIYICTASTRSSNQRTQVPSNVIIPFNWYDWKRMNEKQSPIGLFKKRNEDSWVWTTNATNMSSNYELLRVFSHASTCTAK